MEEIATDKQLLIGALALSVVSIIIATIAVAYVTRKPQQMQSGYVEPQKVTELTQENPAFQLPHASGFGMLIGQVADVSGSTLTLTLGSTSISARISTETAVYAQGADKSPAQYEKELDAFRTTLRYAAGSDQQFFAPDRFETTMLSLTDLAVGDFVRVRTDGSNQPTALVIYRIPPPPVPQTHEAPKAR